MLQFIMGLAAGLAIGLVIEWLVDWRAWFRPASGRARTARRSGKT